MTALASACNYRLRLPRARIQANGDGNFGVGIHRYVVFDVVDGALNKADTQKRRKFISVKSDRALWVTRSS